MNFKKRIQEIAWRALFCRPDLIYNDWLSDELDSVDDLILLFKHFNDKLNRSINKEMGDVFEEEWLEKIANLK